MLQSQLVGGGRYEILIDFLMSHFCRNEVHQRDTFPLLPLRWLAAAAQNRVARAPPDFNKAPAHVRRSTKNFKPRTGVCRNNNKGFVLWPRNAIMPWVRWMW